MKWMIAWLASYPRSGNTFLRIILHRTFGLPTFSVYSSARDAERLAGDAARLLNLVGQTGVECDIDALRADAGLHFVKTHELPDPNNSSPAIVLVRDGRDAVVSYAYFALKTEQGIERPGRELLESTLEQIITGETFGGWSRNVNTWIDRAGRGSVIRFEDLIEDPVAIVRRRASSPGLRRPGRASMLPHPFRSCTQPCPGSSGGASREPGGGRCPSVFRTSFWRGTAMSCAVLVILKCPASLSRTPYCYRQQPRSAGVYLQ